LLEHVPIPKERNTLQRRSPDGSKRHPEPPDFAVAQSGIQLPGTVHREADMAQDLEITVNGQSWAVNASPETPLLYVLMNELRLRSPRFGCGLAQCGSCSVLVDGVEIRSCVTPVADVAGKSVTTSDGLPALYAQQKGLAQAPALHPLQQAFIDVQAPQCGYCYNGMVIKGSELLARNPRPTEAQIRAHMDGHFCRCGTYPRVMKAIQLAATKMAGG
jgi:aerobic-type carbon monoxide dehydrogenase small subunit (CoxS/CutS family)